MDSVIVDSGMVYIKFANKQILKKHVETVHEGIKPFECSICDVKFANTVFPHIVSTETILVWIWKSKGHST